MGTILELRNLTKRFGDNVVVDDVSFDIAECEFITLLGPSGCGKTTTLRMLAGFIAPDGGSITGRTRVLSAPGELVPPERREMGMVFQSYAVWPHKTVFENVSFGLQLKKLPKQEIEQRVEEILDLVGLEGMSGRSPDQLSGGQLQRVALARSLVMEPETLLLDEPLSNLDAKLRERMRTELKEIQRRTGITFVYVTHDQAEAMALSDRVVVMHLGRIQQLGTPREIYMEPANRRVAEFMGQVNMVSASVEDVDDGGQGTLLSDNGLRVAAPVPGTVSAGDDVLLAIRPEDIELRRAGNGGSPAGGNVGKISESVFLGNVVDHEVTMERGDPLRSQGRSSDALEVGASVELEVRRVAVIDEEHVED